MTKYGTRARLLRHQVEDQIHDILKPLELPNDVQAVLYGERKCRGLNDRRLAELGQMATTGDLQPPGFTREDLINEVRTACPERQ